eukprot:3544696-Rhodomonas_salina.1
MAAYRERGAKARAKLPAAGSPTVGGGGEHGGGGKKAGESGDEEEARRQKKKRVRIKTRLTKKARPSLAVMLVPICTFPHKFTSQRSKV